MIVGILLFVVLIAWFMVPRGHRSADEGDRVKARYHR